MAVTKKTINLKSIYLLLSSESNNADNGRVGIFRIGHTYITEYNMKIFT